MDIVDEGDTILTTVETGRIWPGRGFNSGGTLLSRVRGIMRDELRRMGEMWGLI